LEVLFFLQNILEEALMRDKPAIGIAAVVLGLLVSLIPFVIFPVCKGTIELMNDKTIFMKCHWTAMTELLIGALIVIDGILIIAFRQYEVRIALNIMLAFLGLAVLFVPTVIIGMCETVSMACRVGTEPALTVISIIIMVSGISNMFLRKSCNKPEQPHDESSVTK
jgi:hypothetical protein